MTRKYRRKCMQCGKYYFKSKNDEDWDILNEWYCDKCIEKDFTLAYLKGRTNEGRDWSSTTTLLLIYLGATGIIGFIWGIMEMIL